MRIILTAAAVATLVLSVSCKKETPVQEPRVEAPSNAAKIDEAPSARQTDETASQPGDETGVPDMDKNENVKKTEIAIDICRVGEPPWETEIQNPEIKKSFEDCKTGATDPFVLKLNETYSFDLGSSSLAIQLERFDKHEKLDDTIKRINSMAQYEPENVKIEDDKTLSQKHGLEIKKVTYTMGRNEDSVFHEDYYYSIGEHDYRLGMRMDEDELEGLKDGIISNLTFL